MCKIRSLLWRGSVYKTQQKHRGTNTEVDRVQVRGLHRRNGIWGAAVRCRLRRVCSWQEHRRTQRRREVRMARAPAQCHGSSSPRIHCKLPSGLQGSFLGGGWERARGGTTEMRRTRTRATEVQTGWEEAERQEGQTWETTQMWPLGWSWTRMISTVPFTFLQPLTDSISTFYPLSPSHTPSFALRYVIHYTYACYDSLLRSV